ncbi:hypothetical protein FRC10_005252 [Ceratobasidium sp. 414]|nr:hypothetical protein FRC10_005252 [Ceratobasidium sp. 414]
MRTLMEGMDIKLNAAGQTGDKFMMITSETLQLLRKLMDEKVAILQNQATTPGATYADAQQTVQTIRTVTHMQLPTDLLVGRQCILDNNIPIKTGVTCDIYIASFLANEKVVKKVFRVGMSEKENVERYAHMFLRDVKLWATFRSDYMLPFYGIGMEPYEGEQHFQLYMVSPLMRNFDAVTYLRQHKKNPGMKEGIMRIITDAAKGLQYLHNRNPPFVHSGMCGDNILITDSGGGILGGFGLTKAPETFEEDTPVLQTASDVWGWAMVALELISGRPPYYQTRQSHTVMLDIRLNKRPIRAKHADFEQYALKPDEMWALLERCWEFEPEKRPTIDEVLVVLEKMTGRCAGSDTEAVQQCRKLSTDSPAAFTPELASSLNNLSVSLSGLGRREEALSAVQEAVQLYRRQAADKPAGFTPDLAKSLNTLSLRLSFLGRREEALTAMQEAVQLRRQLAADRPTAFMPDLQVAQASKQCISVLVEAGLSPRSVLGRALAEPEEAAQYLMED